MVCQACGCEQVAGSRFCRQCGAAIAAGMAAAPGSQAGFPPTPYPAYALERSMRVRQHLQPLGILWIVFGGLRLLTGLIGAVVMHNLAYGGMFNDAPPFVPHLLGTLAPVIATVSAVMGVASILIGWALLSRQSWGRVAAIVLGILELIKIPFGTALGIYTLWVLAPRTSGMEWDGIVAER